MESKVKTKGVVTVIKHAAPKKKADEKSKPSVEPTKQSTNSATEKKETK